MILISEELKTTTNLKKAVLEIEKHIRIKTATARGYDEAYDGDSINLAFPDSNTRRGRVGKGISQTLDTHCNMGVCVSEPEIRKIGNYSPSNHSAARIVSGDGIAPTVMENHGTVTATMVEQDNPKVIGGIGEKKSNGGTQGYLQDRIYDNKIATSVTTAFNPYYKENLRIRKLTPKECWRLMGFSDEDFEKAEKVNSNAQLYKQAGNSIVIQVLMAIFKEMM